ncbi:glycosyltransferase family 2 protein [Desulfopila inferna]|uniref:glycosyltransferase family 2 protein n=1 Tax=Desulfopila inferna TaxID=468528 RepID=UPI001964B3E1|nr:glycosyltransferase family 2 protein [Desulfopila inferna]MBM9605718.1 glycosyltransferase family 2 protein [Desulfopila inferna]
MTPLIIIFWTSLAAIFYAYLGYPLLLHLLAGMGFGRKEGKISGNFRPSISIIIPAHNEGKILEDKIVNILDLDYPKEKREILIISDGSTDNTGAIAKKYLDRLDFFELEKRSGKTAALNLGLEKARNEIIVFLDASIMLKKDALQNVVCQFVDPSIGCISGEDHIKGAGGEGLYGRYELKLRNLESKLHSIVGASGSFYAQRKKLCRPFSEGLAPDFISVLNTVEQGFRAITEPTAIGYMTAVKKSSDELARKVRTIVRGMTALFFKRQLLNPFRHGFFAFELISHKIIRWLVPFFLISAFVSNMILSTEPFYLLLFLGQLLFYLLALGSLYNLPFFRAIPIGKISNYFVIVNIAALTAWWKYLRGQRLEIWTPSQR